MGICLGCEVFGFCREVFGFAVRRGALGYTRNRKTEEKNHPKPQNRKKIRPKPKTAYKTVKNRYNGDKWGIQDHTEQTKLTLISPKYL